MIDLENVKAYSTDKCVAIKLAELLGVRFNDTCDNYEGEIVGVAYTDDEPDEVSYFSDDSECHLAMSNEITVEQINKMHAEKFGQVESPEEKEALDMIDTTSKQVESLAKGDVSEWDGEYCLEGQKDWFKYKSTYVASNGDMFAMCLVPHSNGGKPFEQYLDAETTEFRDLESPEQKADRERLEAIKAMAQTPKPCGFAIYDICEQLYDAGYRKESK